jgi:hypothetical protein
MTRRAFCKLFAAAAAAIALPPIDFAASNDGVDIKRNL